VEVLGEAVALVALGEALVLETIFFAGTTEAFLDGLIASDLGLVGRAIDFRVEAELDLTGFGLGATFDTALGVTAWADFFGF